jgi:endonuclease G, mitochondrial
MAKFLFKNTLGIAMGLFIGVILGLYLASGIGTFPAFAEIQEIDSQIHQETFLPQSHFFLKRQGYCLNYDGRLKQASWVCEELTRDSLSRSGELASRHVFKEDKDLPYHVRSSLKDYLNSGFDRGHLVCAADQRSNEQAYADTFYLSNISPQVPEFNRNYWLKLEKYVRSLTNSHAKVTVYTGPLFLPKVTKSGKKFVTYQVIGENMVAVPTHYFKIIFTPMHQEAFIVPNKDISATEPLSKFQVSVEKVQRLAGLHFSRIPVPSQ